MRYGQTLFNQQKKVQGWCDSPLTQEGIQRFMSCLETIAKSHADNVLVVAHGGVIMSALRCLDETRFMRYASSEDVYNCSVTILEYTDHFEIEDLTDTSYCDRRLLL